MYFQIWYFNLKKLKLKNSVYRLVQIIHTFYSQIVPILLLNICHTQNINDTKQNSSRVAKMLRLVGIKRYMVMYHFALLKQKILSTGLPSNKGVLITSFLQHTLDCSQQFISLLAYQNNNAGSDWKSDLHSAKPHSATQLV